tara:strand:+ start:301 stop:711 length:411 start_codon:yes stop_codon:yes gene_type:complete
MSLRFDSLFIAMEFPMIHRPLQKLAIATSALFLMAGCASESVSKQEYSEPLQVMAAAEQAGAKSDSQAALHMQFAEENIKKADEYIEDEKYDKARYFLDMAEIDARLALVLAEGNDARAKVKELDDRIQKVRNDTL